MESLCCLVYLSTAHDIPDHEQLNTLLTDAREFNKRYDVTGILLHHEGTFFQYLEGPCDKGLDTVFKRIKASRSHFGVIELLKMPIEHRLFGDWLMGSTDIPEGIMLSLKKASWERFSQKNLLEPNQKYYTHGLQLLQAQWEVFSKP